MRTGTKALLALGMALCLGALAGQAYAGPSTGTASVYLQVTFAGTLSVNVDSLATSTYTMLAYSGAGVTAGNPQANAYASPQSSITVTNNGSVTARWQLDVSTVIGGGNWQLNNATGTAHANTTNGAGQYVCTGSCPGPDQYAIQALFVSSKTSSGLYGAASACPSPNSADWDAFVDTVPAHPGFSSVQPAGLATYLTSQYADSNLTAGAGNGTGLPDSTLGLPGTPSNGDMLPLDNQQPGTGKRGLCVRMTMPSASAAVTQQTIQLEITAIGG